MSNPVLVADIGGTTSRVALARADGSVNSVRTIANDDVPEIAGLLAHAIEESGRARPSAAVIAVAGPVNRDQVKLTNRDWSFSQRGLRRALKLSRLIVVNDFVAVAHALPAMRDTDLISVGGGRGDPRGTMLACGPGTGFGTAVLFRDGRRQRAMASEAGHMRLGAATADEARIVAHVVRERGPAAVEDVLSGPGLARLHRILAGEELSTEAVIAAARSGQGAARATTAAFFRVLGRIVGDLALAFDARGGVFIAGGVGRVLAPLFASSSFREAFEEHPPYQARLAVIPTRVIVHPTPGLLGAAQLAIPLARSG
jgi:glucokinase